jgi:hypothetical protein
MMNKLVAIFLCTLFFACSDKQKVRIPDNIMSKEKMTTVMLDVQLLEATMNLNTFSVDKVSAGGIVQISDILKKNNITKKQYDESFIFYTQHPELLTEIYQLVLNDLSKMQAHVMNKK